MCITNMVAVHMADKDDVDLAQARIVRASHSSTRIVEHTGAVWVFKNKRAVLRAELAVYAAQRSDLDGLGKGWSGQSSADCG